MTYREIVRRMSNQYNSEAKQSNALVQILKLHMPSHMCECGTTGEEEAFCSICDLIEQNSELLDPRFATEKHEIQFLCLAVLPYVWAQSLISQIPVISFTFFGFQNT